MLLALTPWETSTNRDGSNALRPRSSAGLTVMGLSTASTKSRWNSIPFSSHSSSSASYVVGIGTSVF